MLSYRKTAGFIIDEYPAVLLFLKRKKSKKRFCMVVCRTFFAWFYIAGS
jgi:hypothetical protein